jgi:hypothetical protein
MAKSFGSLSPDADHTNTGVLWVNDGADTDLWQAIDSDPDAPNNTDYCYNDALNDDTAFVGFDNFPADFSAIVSMTVAIYITTNGARSNDDIEIFMQVYNAAEAANYTDEVSMVIWNAGNDPPASQKYTQAFTINATGLAASEADWNGARLRIRYDGTQTKGPDAIELRITACELTGTYTPDPVSVNLNSASMTLAGQTLTVDAPVTVSLNTASMTLAGQQLTVNAPAPGALVNLNTASMTLAGQTLADVRADIKKNLNTASMTLAGQQLSVKSDIIRTMNTASMTLAGQQLSVKSNIKVNLNTASMTLAGQQLSVKSDIKRTMNTASMTLAGQQLSVRSDIKINLNTASMTLSGQQLTVSAIATVIVNLNTAQMTLNGQQLSVNLIGGLIVVNLATAQLTLTGQQLTVIVPAVPAPPVVPTISVGRPLRLKDEWDKIVANLPWIKREREAEQVMLELVEEEEEEFMDLEEIEEDDMEIIGLL